MKQDARADPTSASDSAVERAGPERQPTTSRNSLKRQWLVQFDGRDEQVEADDVEVTASGALVFYLSPRQRGQERTLLRAFSPGLRWHCRLESDR